MASVLGAQLYTVREFTKTPADMAKTLRKVRQIGYDAVQLSGHGPIPLQELKRMLDGEGLTVAATHIPFERMQNDLQAVADEHHLLGCKYVAIGGMPAEYRNPEGFARFARIASEVGRKMAEKGLAFAYHNHSWELERVGNRTGLAILYEESDPRYFLGEIDTYWIQHGGGDPSWWIRKLTGRLPILHLKDMTMRGREQIMAEVGEGNLNWEGILAAARDAGVRWYLVEQDTCQRDPFESLAISFRNLRAMGLQ